MRILVLHNAVPPDARADERDVLVQVDAVSRALVELGHVPTSLSCTLDLETLRQQLLQTPPDVVFNLTEGLGGTDRLQHVVPALLEALDLPYTGAPALAILSTNDKLLAKQRLHDAGLPTPAWAVTASAAHVAVPGPMIVKAIHEHASVGMDDAAIVTCRDGRDLAECLRAAESRLGKPCFAEQFIDGREFNLSVLAGPDGPQVLPPAEIDFTAFPPAKPRIVGYSAKWHADTFEFLNTPRRFDFPPSDAGLLARLTEVAVRCWSLFDLRGYVRVDFRVDRAGCPFVLEVNTNPCISPDAGFAAALERAGITYAAAVQRIVEDAVRQPRSLDAEVAGPGCDSTPAAMSKTQPAFRYEVTPADRESVRRIVESTGFFQPAEIDVAIELVDEHLAKGLASGYYFIFAELNGQTIGYACYGPIACAVGSYDLFWIAVDKPQQRCGWGQTLIAEAERRVREAGGRRVYVETSNRPQYAATRTFYERVGYRQEAVLPEFYGVGDDKVIYVKVI